MSQILICTSDGIRWWEPTEIHVLWFLHGNNTIVHGPTPRNIPFGSLLYLYRKSIVPYRATYPKYSGKVLF